MIAYTIIHVPSRDVAGAADRASAECAARMLIGDYDGDGACWITNSTGQVVDYVRLRADGAWSHMQTSEGGR